MTGAVYSLKTFILFFMVYSLSSARPLVLALSSSLATNYFYSHLKYRTALMFVEFARIWFQTSIFY